MLRGWFWEAFPFGMGSGFRPGIAPFIDHLSSMPFFPTGEVGAEVEEGEDGSGDHGGFKPNLHKGFSLAPPMKIRVSLFELNSEGANPPQSPIMMDEPHLFGSETPLNPQIGKYLRWFGGLYLLEWRRKDRPPLGGLTEA